MKSSLRLLLALLTIGVAPALSRGPRLEVNCAALTDPCPKKDSAHDGWKKNKVVKYSISGITGVSGTVGSESANDVAVRAAQAAFAAWTSFNGSNNSNVTFVEDTPAG